MPSPIYEAAQGLEKVRCPMNLIEDDQPVLMVGQIQLGVGQLRQVRWRFQVEIDRVQCVGDLPGQRGLPHLPGPDQGNSGILREELVHP